MPFSVLKLPEKTKVEQEQSKRDWNAQHCTAAQPDFYTVGYAGKDIESFVGLLQSAGVATLVDIRWSPVSQYKPEFSKANLKDAVEHAGITYIHRGEWGVPRDIRALSIGKPNREDIWAWYDAYVLPTIAKRNLDEFFNSMEHPVAFMCVEHDPTECHRHRLVLGFEQMGLIGCDL